MPTGTFRGECASFPYLQSGLDRLTNFERYGRGWCDARKRRSILSGTPGSL